MSVWTAVSVSSAVGWSGRCCSEMRTTPSRLKAIATPVIGASRLSARDQSWVRLVQRDMASNFKVGKTVRMDKSVRFG